MKELTLLGNSKQSFPEKPSFETLETFPNRNPDRDYWVKFDCTDFTSLCPVTGQPDFAKIHIEYMPGERCVETKSLKFYLASFRSQRDFNENITNRIFDDFKKACTPKRLIVEGQFHARGGISLTTRVDSAE
ncbi:MAG: NADPH-dependent 7-cyano-7-deazaguanine reductase QueF [Verrucomicrobia bacterium]|jgi:7-cyano-7-deazaguanine reductase|nr:NADPH-dependent 7-cyano-7-deazaguanine reductase QueF [Verrucomicrobiota bacterium]MBO7391169.1 NADPH-dependent 7-cyano-7-deazaguanine reductase QueF [Verrucomicrobiota bacterium]MBO7524311.1 NADPH-dependent 7-cyano-7-deazaguanine reductase QueF [Verrucomicrobiota bacterium]MBR4250257.1 NADPH-dependent 7-cyano-7-deazaguanine reductase QueF [Verrucomicrobiota bacterium]